MPLISVSYDSGRKCGFKSSAVHTNTCTAFRLVRIECNPTSSLCRKQVEIGRRRELTDVTARVVTYEVFVEGKLEAPKHLALCHTRPLLRSEM